MGSMVGCFDLGIVGYALELESDETGARGVRVWVVCWEKCEGCACLERCEGSASLGSYFRETCCWGGVFWRGFLIERIAGNVVRGPLWRPDSSQTIFTCFTFPNRVLHLRVLHSRDFPSIF